MRDPRYLALKILLDWHKKPGTLDQSLELYSEDISNFPKNDRSLCNAILFGVLRQRESMDWTIRSFTHTSFEKMDVTSLYILRIALFQILHMDKIPVFAAIDTAVEISKILSGKRTAGFINAVLRKAAENNDTLSLPDNKTEPDKFLSIN